jgi:sugar phosphate isomerase/epimerase
MPGQGIDISRVPVIRWADLSIRRYRILDRALERVRINLAQGLDAQMMAMFWKVPPKKHEDDEKTKAWLARWTRR